MAHRHRNHHPSLWNYVYIVSFNFRKRKNIGDSPLAHTVKDKHFFYKNGYLKIRIHMKEMCKKNNLLYIDM